MKVFVGLSGGVDSGTSAALLKERGFEVTGVFIKIWQPEFIECTWREDRLDAMRVAASLGIPFREIDLSEEYKKEVVNSMVRDYGNGITPNPDVLCNEKIKFGAFMRWALREGAHMVATGHYAQVKEGKLLCGVDTEKDQSYFLYRIKEEDLKRVIFPIGAMKKADVRKLAQRFGLPVADKPDSQGLCFVGDVSMSDFLRRFITIEPGKVLDIQGNIIGEHESAALYTIGQRHGFKIFGETAREPHYATLVDMKANTITVSANKEDAMRKEIHLRDIHWIFEGRSFEKVSAQVRYRAQPVAVTLDSSTCTFEIPQICSPGQSVVFYKDDECLGGGIIDAEK